MFNEGDIIANKKNPTYVLQVLNPEEKQCVIVSSTNPDIIGKRKFVGDFKFYKKQELNNTIDDNLKRIIYNFKAKQFLTPKRRKIKSYL